MYSELYISNDVVAICVQNFKFNLRFNGKQKIEVNCMKYFKPEFLTIKILLII